MINVVLCSTLCKYNMTEDIRGLNKNVIDIFICLYVYYKVVESTKKLVLGTYRMYKLFAYSLQ